MNINTHQAIAEYKALINFLDTKPAIWNTIVPLTKSVFMLRTYVTAITQHSYKQTQAATIYPQDKDGFMLIMCDKALALLLKLRTFAKAYNNKALLYSLNYSEEELRSGSELHIIKRCQTIYNKASEHLSKLTAFQVTADELIQFQNAIHKVKPLLTQRNAIASKHIASTANVALLIEEAYAEADKLDSLIKNLVFDKIFLYEYKLLRSTVPVNRLTIESNKREGLQAV